MKNVEIIEFDEKYHQDFKRLSYEWLMKYVSVEPEDEKILNHPRKAILDDGIYFFGKI